MPERDPFNLDRFVQAQAQVFDTALAELQAGRKRSHWMWFVFPQLRGLGHSSMAQSYGIASLTEARAFLNHPVLGARLRQCTQAVVALEGRSLHDIFGSPDDLKFRSCMTLFERLEDGGDAVFTQALERCCQGCRDERTLALLG